MICKRCVMRPGILNVCWPSQQCQPPWHPLVRMVSGGSSLLSGKATLLSAIMMFTLLQECDFSRFN